MRAFLPAERMTESSPIIVPPSGLVHKRDHNEFAWTKKQGKGRYWLLISSTFIERRIKEIAREIVLLLRRKKIEQIHLLFVLKGGIFFGCRLAQKMIILGGPKIIMHFVSVSSYGRKIYPSVHCRIADNFNYLRGKDVLIVEDICDTGLVLNELKRKLTLKAKPSSVKACILLDKPEGRLKRLKNVRADFTGFQIPNVFVVGFGLDDVEYYRELPFIVAARKMTG